MAIVTPQWHRVYRGVSVEWVSMADKLTHLDDQGHVRMVDVGAKPTVRRTAIAHGDFVAARTTIDRIFSGDLPKGEALATARIAAIAAAKRTDEWIPLCHTLGLDHLGIQFDRVADDRVRVIGQASVTARTGVEMEALVAVTAACLTLYDMTKAIDRGLRIENIQLVDKRKGS
mgnify:CR=1 FL=1